MDPLIIDSAYATTLATFAGDMNNAVQNDWGSTSIAIYMRTMQSLLISDLTP